MKELSTHSVLLFRVMYAFAMLPATVWLAFWPLPRRVLFSSTAVFDRAYLLIFALSRICLFFIGFFLLHLAPRGDVVGFYYPEAVKALHGLLVYRDFTSSYAPLFSYLGAVLLYVKDTPLSLIAFTILLDVCAVPLWFAALRPGCDETVFRRGALLYLVQPLMLMDVAIDGGNNAWIALAIAGALFFLAKYRDAWSGLSYATSVILVKFLPIIFAPLLFLGARRRARWAAGFLAPVVLVYGFFLWAGANIFQPLQQEGAQKLGGSLPLLFADVTGFDLSSRLDDAIVILALCACLATCIPITRMRTNSGRVWATGAGLLLLTMAALAFSKKSWTIYIMMVMFILCQLVVRHGRTARILYCFLSFLIIVEPSFLFDRIRDYGLPLHALLLQRRPDALLMVSMYSVEIVVWAYFAWLAAKEIRRAARIDSAPRLNPVKRPPR